MLAAEQDHPSAQMGLSGLYFIGDGVEEDLVKAHMWANLAAMKGAKNVGELRFLIARNMSSQQIEEARELARLWLAQHEK